MSEDLIQKQAEAVREMRSAIEENTGHLKTVNEKYESMSAENKEKYEKSTAALDKLEEKNQEITLALKKAENEALENKERLEQLEKNLLMASTKTTGDYKETPEFKAFNKFVQKWDKTELQAEELKYLRTDEGPQGGYLVPQVLAEDILKKIEEISNVRALSRVRSRYGVQTLNIPVRNTIPTATYEGEAEEATDSNSSYDNETMTAHRQTVVTDTTRDILNFSGWNMVTEITEDAVTAFAKGEGLNFIQGDGVKKPQGILDSTSKIEQINGSGSSTITMDDVIQLYGELKQGYNAVYFMNKKTLAVLRTEKDSNGNYLWQIGGVSQPSTINDVPYTIMQDMPDLATNSLSLGVGDFFRGYNILDSVVTELLRDDLTQAKKAKVLFTWHRWNDGRVVLAEAFKLLKAVA